jgi:hypothetical protein
VFPSAISDELAARAILKLRGIELEEGADVSKFWTHSPSAVDGSEDAAAISRVTEELSPMAGEYKIRPGFTVTCNEELHEDRESVAATTVAVNMYLKGLHAARQAAIRADFEKNWSAKFSSIETWMESQVRQKRSQIAIFTVGQVTMYIHLDTLKNREEGERDFSILVDPVIFDGVLTGPILKLLGETSRRNRRLSEDHAATRPTLFDEMEDIHTILYGEEATRLQSLNIIRFFFGYPGNERSSFIVFEWSLTTGPRDAFAIPTTAPSPKRKKRSKKKKPTPPSPAMGGGAAEGDAGEAAENTTLEESREGSSPEEGSDHI